VSTPEGPRRGGLLFTPVTDDDFFEDIPLVGRPEFDGGILLSDHAIPKGDDEMDIATKEITQTPTTEVKDAPVESGSLRPDAVRRPASERRPCVDPSCQFAGSWHVHEVTQ